MSIEIERKFLVKGPFKEQAASRTHIIQGYISSQKGRTVRVRLRDQQAYLTIKGPSRDGGLSRYEFEKEITIDEGLSLLTLCEPGVIEKDRWLVPCGNHTFEVDEFFGENEGLLLAEVELSAPDEPFEKPSIQAQEVTGDRRYYNSSFRINPYSKWPTKD